MKTPDCLFTAFSRPKPGSEREFDDWYESTHMSEVLAVPGLESLQRFRLSPTQLDLGVEACPHRQVALGGISGSPADFAEQLVLRSARGEVTQSEALDDARGWFFRPVRGGGVSTFDVNDSQNLLLWFGDPDAFVRAVGQQGLGRTESLEITVRDLPDRFTSPPPDRRILAFRFGISPDSLVRALGPALPELSGSCSAAWLFEPSTKLRHST
jgi:hypothetical protein